MHEIRQAVYFPTIKWKEGERKALATFRSADRSSLIPLIVVPAAGEFENEDGRVLSPSEHILAFGPRLEKVWGRRPAFIDATPIDDAKHASAVGAHPLAELLERARLAKAMACPIMTLQQSSSYFDVIARFTKRHSYMPTALKISAADIGSYSLRQDMSRVLNIANINPARTLLVLDLGSNIPALADDAREFADILTDHLNELPYLHEWVQLAVSMTSFPANPKVKAGMTKEYTRIDWLIYKQLQADGRLLRVPAFGDYAVDASPFRRVTGRVAPSAQLRHSSEISYMIVKGKQCKRPIGYAEIFSVAERLVSMDGFPRGTHSKGDEFVFGLADRSRSTGTASTWRWAATDHHFSLVMKALGSPSKNSPEALDETTAPTDGQRTLL